jgi:hypothetical protein
MAGKRPNRPTEGLDGLLRPMDRAKQLEAIDLGIARVSPRWPLAVAFLRAHFSAETAAQIRDAMPTEDWPAGYHTFWGMGVRNALRSAGFGEREFAIGNLDNIYVQLVEEAVRPLPAGAVEVPYRPGGLARLRAWLWGWMT